MNDEVIITCAVTGAGDTAGIHPELPVTPQQIAAAAIAAAEAGAAIAHIHVRDPRTGAPSRRLEYYREVVERIRASGTDVIINLTTGMGGDLFVDDAHPSVAAPGSDMVPALERLEHIEALLPEMCTLDCGSMNFSDGDYVAVVTADQLRTMARRVQELGVKPELEVFDTGHVRLANKLIEEGLIDGAPLFQLCIDIPYGAPAETRTMAAMVDLLAARCGVGGVRDLPHGDADRGPVRAARRQRPRRPGGQPLPAARRLRQQRAAGREGGRPRRGARRAHPHCLRGARQARPASAGPVTPAAGRRALVAGGTADPDSPGGVRR